MKNSTTITVLSILFCLNTLTAQQVTVDHGVMDRTSGNLLYLFQYVDVQGNPFLKNNWTNATLIGKDGYAFKNEKVKFDTYNNKFVYNRNDSSFELVSDINAVYMYPNANDTAQKQVFKKGFDVNSKITADKYLQVLAEGKVTLLKYYNKDMEEYTEYGNANKLKRFKELEQYYVFQDHKYSQLTLSAKNLENVTGSQWTAVQDYMKKNNLSAKNEKDWSAIIAYYNTL